MVAPPLGVSLRYFQHLITQCGGRHKLHGLTTAQVCFDYIVPLTKSTELSLVDHLANDASTSHFVSEANWYISHAWSYQFLETVDSLEAFFANHSLAHEAVLWFCVFNNNQHLAHSYPFEYWSMTFKTQLAAIGNVVMIMHPWNDPIVLRRSWCVFEVYVAVTMQARFEMAMAPGQLEYLVNDMLRPTALNDMLGTIKSEASETTVPSDRDGIFELIRAETSFTAVDRLIFSTISDWMMRTLSAQIASGLSPLDEAWRLACLANIHAAEFAWSDVVTTAARACDLFEAQDVDARCYVGVKALLGRAYAQVGEPDVSWRPLFAELLAIDDLDVAMVCEVRNIFAKALDTAAFYAEVRNLCLETYEMARTHLGPMHPTTIETMSKLGASCFEFADFDASAAWFTKCLNARLALLGPDHHDTMHSRSFLASIYHVQGKCSDALAAYEDIVASLERTHGPSHFRTIESLLNIAVGHRALGALEQAEATLLLIRARASTQPLSPWHCVQLPFLLAVVYWTKRNYVRTKYFLEMTLTRALADLPPGHGDTYGDTSLRASALYRFLLDPVFAAYHPRNDVAWARVVAFFATNERESEVWQNETCNACRQRLQGRWIECRRCIRSGYHFCTDCFHDAAYQAFCDHAAADHISYVPPRRFLLEQAMVASDNTMDVAGAAWCEYDAYCTANHVQDAERAPYASFAPLETRGFHPML
ncbi:hypothetical protein SDRG_11129 [Saprolegnia diclina VS20]|uniref:ZZ-type domain-containing protein n=1 Tax=Saprolegnia diclina (strain VS20) TaxID=1156394 RepID=T0Q961_SAPDV|nr:hypothetical protein SDRG_11129 [Saprolegnia diclina VS20]EQC31206.1 hypothetical protein SDRG_11129 [Saprolegnia diclina VS20]|eukprot:XP_008615379.1 hypothetical protein SDRG_11129 [Saprolegnia diclina VS20]